MADTILQSPILTDFVYPFVIVFAILFALLEWQKVFGQENKQVHAILSGVIGLVFVSAVYPKEVVENLALFLSVAIVVIFMVFVVWNFMYKGSGSEDGEGIPKNMNKYFMIISGVVVIIALVTGILWAFGVQSEAGTVLSTIYDFIINNIWGSELLNAVIFIVLVGGAIAIVVKGAGGGSNG
ncbi:MAG: hypothetical protein ABEI74_03175 [Candidatus Pacearchaeota archaeon]